MLDNERHRIARELHDSVTLHGACRPVCRSRVCCSEIGAQAMPELVERLDMAKTLDPFGD